MFVISIFELGKCAREHVVDEFNNIKAEINATKCYDIAWTVRVYGMYAWRKVRVNGEREEKKKHKLLKIIMKALVEYFAVVEPWNL